MLKFPFSAAILFSNAHLYEEYCFKLSGIMHFLQLRLAILSLSHGESRIIILGSSL